MPRFSVDPVTICNMALSHLGQLSGIVDFDTDRSAAGTFCRRFYGSVLDEVYRDFPWPFARKFDTIALVSDPTVMATPEWMYAYRVPTDCIHVRRILNGFTRQETQSSRVPYIIGVDDGGGLIYCDYAPVAATATTPALPMIEYTKQQDAASQYPADFGQMMALRLAVYIAPGLTAGDKFNMGGKAAQKYEFARLAAQNNAINEEQPDQPVDAEWIQARTGGYGWPGNSTPWQAYPSAGPDL